MTAFPHEVALELFGSETLDFDCIFKTIPDWSRDDSSDLLKQEGVFATHNPDGSVVTAICQIIHNGQFQGYFEIFQTSKPITRGEMLLLEEAVKIVSALQPFSDNRFVLSHLTGKPMQRSLIQAWLSAKILMGDA